MLSTIANVRVLPPLETKVGRTARSLAVSCRVVPCRAVILFPWFTDSDGAKANPQLTYIGRLLTYEQHVLTGVEWHIFSLYIFLYNNHNKCKV